MQFHHRHFALHRARLKETRRNRPTQSNIRTNSNSEQSYDVESPPRQKTAVAVQKYRRLNDEKCIDVQVREQDIILSKQNKQINNRRPVRKIITMHRSWATREKRNTSLQRFKTSAAQFSTHASTRCAGCVYPLTPAAVAYHISQSNKLQQR